MHSRTRRARARSRCPWRVRSQCRPQQLNARGAAGLYPQARTGVCAVVDGLQVFTGAEAATFAFDVLDASKLIPEELVLLQAVGKLVHNRNPDNVFAETGQVACCTAKVVPGIDFTNEPLLQACNFPTSTPRSAVWEGPSFTKFPSIRRWRRFTTIIAMAFTARLSPRTGQRRAQFAGRQQPLSTGRRWLGQRSRGVGGKQVRAKAERFAEHIAQARSLWQRQGAAGQQHIAHATNPPRVRADGGAGVGCQYSQTVTLSVASRYLFSFW